MPTFLELVSSITKHGFTTLQAEKIASAIINNDVILLALSGKLASGKDSLALGTMERLGVKEPIHVYFGDSIKNEINQTIALLNSLNRPSVEQFAKLIEIEQGVSSVHLAEIAELLIFDYEHNHKLEARDRTPNMRRVLQLWGTEVRRGQDPLYWVNKTLKKALTYALNGYSVYLTDARFPNEVAPSQEIGFVVGRVEITTEVQQERLFSRDAMAIDPTATAHSSETSLDGYLGFDFVIDNNGAFSDSLDALYSKVSEVLRRGH